MEKEVYDLRKWITFLVKSSKVSKNVHENTAQ